MMAGCSTRMKYHIPEPPPYCTVRTVDAVVPPELAPMVVTPCAEQLARPEMLGAFAIVATLELEELQ